MRLLPYRITFLLIHHDRLDPTEQCSQGTKWEKIQNLVVLWPEHRANPGHGYRFCSIISWLYQLVSCSHVRKAVCYAMYTRPGKTQHQTNRGSRTRRWSFVFDAVASQQVRQILGLRKAQVGTPKLKEDGLNGRCFRQRYVDWMNFQVWLTIFFCFNKVTILIMTWRLANFKVEIKVFFGRIFTDKKCSIFIAVKTVYVQIS